MAITTAVVTVGTTATQLAAPQAVTSAAVGASGRGTVTVINTTATIIYLGGAGVTASGAGQGLPLGQNAIFSIDLAFDDVLYAITASGTAAINVLNAMTV